MKNILTNLFLAGVAFLAFFSCSPDQSAPSAMEMTLDDNLVRSRAKYEANINARGDGNLHSFEIQSIARTHNTLNVVVKGGCSPEDFTFVWDGRIAESYPTQIWLLLTHEQTDGPCDSESIFELDLDLSKLEISQADLDNCIIHVGNGSIKQDLSIDENGVVSQR